MKQHLSHYSVWIIACLLLGVNLHAQEVKPVIVHVEKAGTLSSLIDPAMKYQITNLTVTGELNGTDIRYIRLMAGSADTATYNGPVWSVTEATNFVKSGIDPEATKKFNKTMAERRAARFLRGDTIEGKLSFLNLSGATIVSGGEEYIDYKEGLYTKEVTTSDGELGCYMFYGCESLTSVVLPTNITKLPHHLFYYCRRLTYVTLPENLTIIRPSAFEGCSSLASVTFPESLERIEDAAFSYCKGLTSLVFPARLTTISSYAFRGCTGLTSLVIPNNVVHLELDAFTGCTGLSSVTMPDENLGINEDYTAFLCIFTECVGMKEIHVYPTNPKYTSVDGILFSKDGKTLIAYPMGRSGDYTVPEGVTSINRDAFDKCTGLTSIIIPNSVTQIGENAFSWCSGLSSVTLSKNITTIADYAFSNCSSLSSITIPERVTSIGHMAFIRCEKLTSIHIPENVTQIGSAAFMRCERLTSVTLPNAAIVADDSFCGCTLLKEYIVSEDNLSYCTVDGVLFSKDKKNLIAFPAGKSKSYMIPDGVKTIGAYSFSRCKELTSITLPKSITTIGADAFSSCTGLTSIKLPNRVAAIGDYAFLGCTGLTSLILSDNLTTVGTKAFSDCSGLTSLTLPKGLTSFGYRAIYGCNSLKKIYCKSVIPPAIGKTPSHTSDTFGENPRFAYKKSCVLYVPNRAVQAYSLANEWSSFVNIRGE
ncbi:MAG: leucine-rich repeat domain-containing protein [Bacteroidales bacterium]|nr:leucine-rich repeat domain-containing protein [Bacteroidales bacterium]